MVRTVDRRPTRPAKEAEEPQAYGFHLTKACWPVFEYVIHFMRQVKNGTAPSPEEVRYGALDRLREAEDRALEEPASERAWLDRIKAMLIYFIDDKMCNTEWHGREYWLNMQLQTDPEGLRETVALGGEKFFSQCTDLQKEHEQAERRDRRDKDELAEQLNLYYACLRLGFRGMYDQDPHALADYAKRLFTRLPAYGTTRSKELFPDAYHHNDERPVDYRIGMTLTMMLIVFGAIFLSSFFAFRFAWSWAVGDLETAATAVRSGQYFESPSSGSPPPAKSGASQ